MKKQYPVMSMVNPSTDLLMTKVDSRYALVIAGAKRARQLLEGANILCEHQSTKNVSNALEEIAEDDIRYVIKEKRG